MLQAKVKLAIQNELDLVAADLDSEGHTDLADRIDKLSNSIQTLNGNKAQAQRIANELKEVERLLFHLEHNDQMIDR